MPSESHHLKEASVGAFRGRVGHKAGGFIAKKFFHPSNFDNQEKLWQAIEQQKEDQRKQQEFLRKREEEKRLELLREEVFANTGRLAGNFVGIMKMTPEQRESVDEMKARLAELANQTPITRIAVYSRYPEDVLEMGHSEVWGSWFDGERWGYKCCKVMVRDDPCPKKAKRDLD